MPTICREYLGEKQGIRYKLYHHGVLQYQKVGDTSKEASTVQRSYCFDYRMLAEAFNINLEKAAESAGDTAHLEDEEATKTKQTVLPF